MPKSSISDSVVARILRPGVPRQDLQTFAKKYLLSPTDQEILAKNYRGFKELFRITKKSPERDVNLAHTIFRGWNDRLGQEVFQLDR